MQVEKILSENLRHQFKISAPAKDLHKKFDAQLQKIGAKARIPGFRPGKIPEAVLKQRYGADSWQDAGNALLREAIEQIDKNNKFHNAIDPIVDVIAFEEGKDFECTVTFEVLPEIKLKDFKDIALEKLTVTVNEDDIEARLKQMHAEHSRYQEPPEARSAKKGDLVSVKWSGILEDGKGMEIPETYQILLGPEKGDSPFFPVVKALYSKAVGDTFDEDVKFPLEEKTAGLAGKLAKIKVQVHKIEEPITFKMDDNFAKEFQAETLEELRKSVRSSVEHEAKKVAHLYLKRHLLDALNMQYDFDLPPTLVENEFKAIWGHLQQELENARASGELEGGDEKPEEELKTEYEEIAKRRVRLGLLISHLADLHKLHLKEEEVRMAIFQEAMRYQSQMNDVIKYYVNNKQALQNLVAPLLEDKVVDFIMNASKLTERHVDFSTLKKVVRGVIPTPYEDEDEEEEEAKPVAASKTTKPKLTKVKGKEKS